MDLYRLGWDEMLEDKYQSLKVEGDSPGKVSLAQGQSYTIISETGTGKGTLSGKFRNAVKKKNQYPVVGDWVVYYERENVEDLFIRAVLPRRSSFARKLPISGGRKLKNGVISGGIIEEQVICANIDTAFIVTGLDGNFEVQRIERYITLVHGSGASPVLLLNKADICESASSRLEEVEKVGMGVPVHVLSALDGTGMEIFDSYLVEGKSVVFLGSSGVGKSTIVNALLGEERQRTNTVSRLTGKGRHTTVKSEIILHPSGAMIIDTPGLRELQLWASIDDLNLSYRDIHELSLECRYADCKHDTEPGCAVKDALAHGVITPARLDSYRKQVAELARLDRQKYAYERSLSKKEKLRAKQGIRR
ncbi:MAG: ribosome small subunit-dependent GTPase A [Dehalococcoidales bacterium]|nr:ribosome small subunit-dependent GTPase A [Dehalococcoidales bacterium]